MSLTNLDVGGESYVAYATEAEADVYLAVDPVRGSAWAALTAGDPKESLLVAATRRLDLLAWQGEKTGGGAQENAWPRTGLQYPDGTPIPDNEVPIEVENACILLAGSINITPSDAEAATSGSNRKRLKAGSAEIEFFRPELGKALQDETAFKLVQPFLEAAAGSAALGPLASGTGGVSEFSDQDRYGKTRGFP